MKTTALTQWHQRHGAKLEEFGGYSMPIDYGSILNEHMAVRTGAGLFDVSHMGEFIVRGPDASACLDQLVTNLPSGLEQHQALYSPMCYAEGGVVDDLLIYRLADEVFMMVVNASNIDKDWEWVMRHKTEWPGATVTNVSNEMALIAIQGPTAADIVASQAEGDIASLEYYHFIPDAVVGGVPVLLSRTGYTGEDGFELYLSNQHAVALWERMVDAGARPAGLGARDTLRLEARLPLYGHELSAAITPLEAGLGPFVRWDKKGSFIGHESLVQQKRSGIVRKIVGLDVQGGIARAGYQVVDDQHTVIGTVTSGTFSPSLKKAIALALVPIECSTVGSVLTILIRGRAVHATVVKTPFYKRR